MKLDPQKLEKALKKSVTMGPPLLAGETQTLADSNGVRSYIELAKKYGTVKLEATFGTMFELGFEAGYLYKEDENVGGQ